MSITVRQATESDIPQIRDIFNFYIENTTISFRHAKAGYEYIASRMRGALERKLPYLVAVEPEQSDTIRGFCHVSPWSTNKAGYQAAVELTLFLRHDVLSKGIGTALMSALFERLRESYVYWEADGEVDSVKENVHVRQVYAIMSQDLVSGERWTARVEKTREWYETKFGFKEVGRMKGIGTKFGKSIDVVYLCKILE